MKIYKYMGPEIVSKSFSEKDFCKFKCSYPKDFNDPYELFLTIDFKQEPGILAYYTEIIGKLEQRPITCFSKFPDILPMWAHYGHTHRGVVVEIDENMIIKHIPEIKFGNVDYCDEPDENLFFLLQRAYGIGKPRYHYLLQQGVYSAAYYTKQECWQYERERRLIASDHEIEVDDGMMLLKLPVECVTGLIVGCNASNETKTNVASLAENIGANYYELKIGKTTAKPYFINSNLSTFKFNGSDIVASENHCQGCNEPISAISDKCSWCSIEKHHRDDAAFNNPMRILHREGLLEEYYQVMNTISKK